MDGYLSAAFLWHPFSMTGSPPPSLVFPPATADFAAAASAWLQYVSSERRMSPLSLDAYARDLRQFVAFLAEYQGDARAWRRSMR